MPYIGGANVRTFGIPWNSIRSRPTRVEPPQAAAEAHERPPAQLSAGPEGRTPLVPGGTPEGGVQSRPFTSAKAAIASMLGVATYPAPATLKVNGKTVTIDLAVESLSSIAARVLSEARTRATVEEEALGGSVHYRLAVDGEVEPAGPADETVAALMGFLREPHSPLPSPGDSGPAPETGRHAEMVERFTAIDAAMSRIREQPAPLMAELRGLQPLAGIS